MHAITEFKTFLKKDNIISIDKIEWWLLKYADNYELIKNTKTCEWCPKGLPCICETKSDETIFLAIFPELLEVCELHRKEQLYAEEVKVYATVKDDKTRVNQWVNRNILKGAEKDLIFKTEHLNENKNGKPFFQIASWLEELKIFVSLDSFKNTINFFDIFEELYWTNEFQPDYQKENN